MADVEGLIDGASRKASALAIWVVITFGLYNPLFFVVKSVHPVIWAIHPQDKAIGPIFGTK